MNSFENLLNQLFSISVWDIAQLSVLLFLLIYIIFSVVVIRQVKSMIQALNGTLDLPLRLIAWIHLGIAVFVFFLALIVL